MALLRSARILMTWVNIDTHISAQTSSQNTTFTFGIISLEKCMNTDEHQVFSEILLQLSFYKDEFDIKKKTYDD